MFRVVGAFAEGTTVVEERRDAGRVEFVVTTGLLEGQSVFRPHGHVVRLVVEG